MMRKNTRWKRGIGFKKLYKGWTARMFRHGLMLLGFLLLCACTPTEEPVLIDATKFKAGRYEGHTIVYGLDIYNVTFLHAGGDYAIAQYQKLEDQDSLVVRFFIKGQYADSGDTIRFFNLMRKQR